MSQGIVAEAVQTRRNVIDPLTQARFDAGTEVGELAKRLFGDFVEATTYKTAVDGTSASTSERWLQPHRKPLQKVLRI